MEIDLVIVHGCEINDYDYDYYLRIRDKNIASSANFETIKDLGNNICTLLLKHGNKTRLLFSEGALLQYLNEIRDMWDQGK